MGRSKLSTGNWAPKIKTTLFSSSIFSFLRPCSPRLHERLRNAWRIPRTNWDRLRSRENKFILVGSYGGSDPSFRKTQDQTAGARGVIDEGGRRGEIENEGSHCRHRG